MPRRRKRKRPFNAAPLLLAALVLGALVAWAVYPRPRAHHHSAASRARVRVIVPTPAVAQASPVPSPAQTSAPAPSPSAATPAASPSSSASAGQVAIIIDDCGQWLQTERGYIALPIPLTLSVLPHVRYTAEIAREAADSGKGVMLHLPMEPLSHVDPGPGEITTEMSDDAVTRQTRDDVAQVPLAQGVNNHEGSQASADDRVMKDVMAVVKAHGLFFIDSRTNPKTVGAEQAEAAQVPNASRDVFLDNQADVAYTESMLEQTVAIAKRNGSAIAIGHPKPTTLQALRAMYPKMQAEGVRFVLASQLVR